MLKTNKMMENSKVKPTTIYLEYISYPCSWPVWTIVWETRSISQTIGSSVPPHPVDADIDDTLFVGD
jgi:hypothetical protein